MHPIVARIHPSIRTGLVAWFVSRSLLAMARLVSGQAIVAVPASFGGGAPARSLLCHAAGLAGADTGALVIAVLAEVAMLAATMAVYRFVRRDQLPQSADRATWLWAACPAMAWTLPAGAWTFAIALSAVALWAVTARRHLLAATALAAAIGFKPEALLLWPGLGWLGWVHHNPGKQPSIYPWLTSLGPPAAFAAMVGLAMTLAGRFGISLRTLASAGHWRRAWPWAGSMPHLTELVLLAGVAAGVWLAAAYRRHVPPSWPLLALPCLVWPLLQQPAAVTGVAMAVPFFGYLARATDQPTLERPVLVASMGALVLLAS